MFPEKITRVVQACAVVRSVIEVFCHPCRAVDFYSLVFLPVTVICKRTIRSHIAELYFFFTDTADIDLVACIKFCNISRVANVAVMIDIQNVRNRILDLCT